MPKPKITDAISTLLDGENQQRAVEFISHLKDNKVSFQWTNTNTWKMSKKSTPFCYIKVGVVYDTATACIVKFTDSDTVQKGSWVISPPFINTFSNEHNISGIIHTPGTLVTFHTNDDDYEEVISNKKMINTIWSKVRPCSNCGNKKKCAPGLNIKWWGKELTNRCKFIGVPFVNPDYEELECLKMLIKIFINNL